MDDDNDGGGPGRLSATVWGRRFTAGEVALWNLAGLAGLAPPDEAYPSASVLEWALEALGDNPDLRDVGELSAGTVNAVRAFLGKKGLLEGVEGVGKVEVRTRLEEVSEEELLEERDRDRERLFQGSLVRRWRTVPEGSKVLWPELLDADGSLRVRTEGEGAVLLVLDVLLAELLEELGQPKTAAKVRATPAEERGRRWKRPTSPCPGPSELAPKACSVVMQAVWKRILAERERARKEAEARGERLAKVPVPSMHGLTARVVTGLGRKLDTSELRGLAAGIVAPPEPGRWVQLSETAGDTAGVLAAWLATQAHRQWVSGGFDMADRVEVVASKEELVRMGLMRDSGSPAKVLEEALALLASTRLMGGADDKQPGSGRLVLDYFLADSKHAARSKGKAPGGRASAVYVVTVGWPLMPLRLEALAAERGFTVPRELAWYGPVLDPAWAPLTGNARTHRTQRLAFAVGAGQWLVSRREEYAELGGVRLDTLRPFLKSMGLYHRSHASLAEDVAERWREKPGQPPLPTLGPAGPLLVATKVDGVYRLGPDYKAQEALILRNAEVTEAARKRQRRGRK